MQFLPSTRAEPGIGQGDIRNPRDAIHAAARSLRRRGGLKDIRRGLWGYTTTATTTSERSCSTPNCSGRIPAP